MIYISIYLNIKKIFSFGILYSSEVIKCLFFWTQEAVLSNAINKGLLKPFLSVQSFEFVDIRHYLFYVGLFQEIEIPQSNIFKNSGDLKQYYDIF